MQSVLVQIQAAKAHNISHGECPTIMPGSPCASNRPCCHGHIAAVV